MMRLSLTLISLLLLLSAVARAGDQLFVELALRSGSNINTVGAIRSAVTNKTEALVKLTTWTNAATGIAKGYTVSARLHHCTHVWGEWYPGCTTDLLCGKSAEEATPVWTGTNAVVTVQQVVRLVEGKALYDNPPQFTLPCTAATADALIQRICSDEFSGKQVVTNMMGTVAGDTGK